MIEAIAANELEQFNRLAFNYLRLAERDYGPPAPGWTFKGVWPTFAPSHPYLDIYGREVHMLVTKAALRGNKHYQISHEAVHALQPRVGAANVLEEGTAVLHSWKYTGGSADDAVTCPAYYAAAMAVRQLIGTDHAALKRLRELQPYLSDVTQQELRGAFPNAPDVLVAFLLGEFPPPENVS